MPISAQQHRRAARDLGIKTTLYFNNKEIQKKMDGLSNRQQSHTPKEIGLLFFLAFTSCVSGQRCQDNVSNEIAQSSARKKRALFIEENNSLACLSSVNRITRHKNSASLEPRFPVTVFAVLQGEKMGKMKKHPVSITISKKE